MHLFTVTLPQAKEQAAAKLLELLIRDAADLHMLRDNGEDRLVRFDTLDNGGVRCTGVLPGFRLTDHAQHLYERASRAIAEYVVAELESDIMTGLIRRKLRNHAEADASVIRQYCVDLLYGSDLDGLGAKFRDADKNRRKAKIAEELEQYLQEQSVLHLAGITTFRLKAYREELAEIVDYALDEYVLDKQYQEFISLLKYFVCLQETKVPAIHLVHKGGHEFEMYNERFQALEPKPHTDRLVAEMLETEINIEDMVISSLISVSPKRITIHTRQPGAQVIRTIETIFDSRVQICEQCSSCVRHLGEMDKTQL